MKDCGDLTYPDSLDRLAHRPIHVTPHRSWRWEALILAASCRSGAVSELGQFLELFLGCARQFDLVAGLVDDQAVIGNRDQAAADAEKTADLQNREQGVSFVAANHKVIDLADAL